MEQNSIQKIFSISNQTEFEARALEVFQFQYHQNPVYYEYCKHLEKSPSNVFSSKEIPFLPITFFKTHTITSSQIKPQIVFESSGTTGSRPSKHYVSDTSIYLESFRKGFTHFYGSVEDFCILALLPSYLEREGSSLVYMISDFVSTSKHPSSGFYLYDLEKLQEKLLQLEKEETKTLLIGVSFALLDLAEQFPTPLKHTIIMETGGMKGKRKEMIREELHQELRKAFQVKHIHSEYGMTELLSQCYSKGNGIFESPPWMKVLIRDPEDPLSLQTEGKSGGVNIIDLANLHSCSFIATQDLGKVHADGSFEIIGRFDHSDIRGCNLMAL